MSDTARCGAAEVPPVFRLFGDLAARLRTNRVPTKHLYLDGDNFLCIFKLGHVNMLSHLSCIQVVYFVFYL